MSSRTRTTQMTKYAQAAAGTQTAFFKALMSVTVNLTQNTGLRQHNLIDCRINGIPSRGHNGGQNG